ncbi:hypothetical protein PCASD_08433 [Puccinia coronata f. sp. avenae]|uniref:Tet-like 2OG-Fe(II) oxygenase domain-containing protein n=1 Tax=Puccinia coronata f. sp. avenae TaxID=200324 RepID=A0A2N5UMZ0_9BASI|nr:hypothetical protein PCASD_08433 [Puccinia coronata f. sp. avenae]
MEAPPAQGAGFEADRLAPAHPLLACTLALLHSLALSHALALTHTLALARTRSQAPRLTIARRLAGLHACTLARSHALTLACSYACTLLRSHTRTLAHLHARSLACTCLLARLHLLTRTSQACTRSQAGRLVRLYARTLARSYARTHARSLACTCLLARLHSLACTSQARTCSQALRLARLYARTLVRSHSCTRSLAPPRLALTRRLAGLHTCTLAGSQARMLARSLTCTCLLARSHLLACTCSLAALPFLAWTIGPPCSKACTPLRKRLPGPGNMGLYHDYNSDEPVGLCHECDSDRNSESDTDTSSTKSDSDSSLSDVPDISPKKRHQKKNFDKKRGGKHTAATIASVTNLPQTSGTGVFDLPCTRLDLFPDITKDYRQRKKELKLAKEKYKKYGGPKPSEETIVKRQPTSAEINAAYSIIKNPDLFYLFERRRVRVFDKKLNPDKTKSIIADIVFTNLKTISQQMRDDLDFFLAFLNTSKKFVNKVGSEGRLCVGSMWAIGWRKSMSGLEIVGQYVDTDAIDSNMEEWRQHIQDSERAGKIIWDLFYPIGNVALETNQQFMIEHNLPAFCYGHIPNTDSDNPRAKNFFSSNLPSLQKAFSTIPTRTHVTMIDFHLPSSCAFLLGKRTDG